MIESIRRIGGMNSREIAWRGQQAVLTSWNRARAAVRKPRWDRRLLVSALEPAVELESVRTALSAGAWQEAQRRLSQTIWNQTPRFLLDPHRRADVVAAILQDFPAASREARSRADRIASGHHDLLGYDGLRFDPPRAGED